MSSRMEGLVAELSQLVGKQDAYCVSLSNAEGKAMQALRQKMISTPWAEERNKKRTMFFLRRGDVHRSLRGGLVEAARIHGEAPAGPRSGHVCGLRGCGDAGGLPDNAGRVLGDRPLLGDLAVILLEVRRL